MPACILLPTRSLDGNNDSATTPLDLQRRPTPLPLGHPLRKGQGDVARRRGDRVLCYHSAPERSLYSIAEVTRDPYPDPHDRTGKNLVADLRAFEKLPRQVTLVELRGNPALKKMKLLKNVRLIISLLTDLEHQEILRMAGIVATPGIPLP